MNSKNNIWVYIDLRNKRHFDESINVLGAGTQLAEFTSGKCIALLTGTGGDIKTDDSIKVSSCIPVEEAAGICIDKGADIVSVLEQPDLDQYRPDFHAKALSGIVKEKQPKVVLFPLSDFAREIAALCAAYNDSGLIADCVEFSIEDGQIIAGCPSWGGEIMARLTYTNPDLTGFATVSPGSFSPAERKGNPGAVERITVKGDIDTENPERVSIGTRHAGKRKLEDADIVVVGGAGVGNADGFSMVRQLSAAIGGEVGATRPPVINHWIDEERLIGQTGKTVRPELLISIGTSGAVQYTAGITDSDYIVAINRDPNSPVFHVADVGIVADAKTIMPLITGRIKKLVMRDIADFMNVSEGGEAGTGLGEKVKKIRESHDWTIEALAQQTDQTPEFIQKVEENEVVPSVSFLLKLSRALGVDPGTFLSDEEKAHIQDKRAQAFTTRTKNYAYQTLTPGAENQHLRGFMITIEAKQAHKPVAYKHEGEEFIYVMEGTLELTLDNKVNNLKAGESMHYNSEIPHKLKNKGNETTRCLVMLYTP
ncbi:MAG: FAD-binding protein [Desulfobacteraceae bacterium]|jgi:electron transfer flavoprotein alpha subunit/quercetin dioxygenase-like cupin family protein